MIVKRKLFSFRDFLNRANKWANPNYKTEKEVLEERRLKNKSQEANRIAAIESRLPAEYKKLKDLDSELSKIHPKLGDWDEYASIHLSPLHDDEINPEDKVIPVIHTYQYRTDFSYDTENKCWIDNNQGGKRVPFSQVKAALLKEYRDDEEDWNKNRYWTDDENEKVLSYLRNSQKTIKSRI